MELGKHYHLWISLVSYESFLEATEYPHLFSKIRMKHTQ